MYEIEVTAEFAAAHAILIGGEPEPLHGHNWHVTATLAGAALDGDGLLCDFHVVERSLQTLVGRWHNRNLNEVEPFSKGGAGGGALTLNPTAEIVARSIAEGLSADLKGVLAESPRSPMPGRAAIDMNDRRPWLVSVRITEAPGCAATYYLPGAGRPTPSRPQEQ